MIASPSASANSTSVTAGASRGVSAACKPDNAPAKPYASDVSDTKVTLSGKAIMLSRLFNTTDSSFEPRVETNKSKHSGLVYDFLSQDDRKIISKIYDYACANGIDPVKVDNVAFDLASYRQSDGVLGYSGCDYDLTGQPVERSFNSSDESIAQRILTSKAINDTEIDHGFLRKILDPGYFPTHASDFQFLQETVFAFSALGSDGAADPNVKPVIRPKASDFSPIKIEQPDDGKSLVQERLFGLTRSGVRVAPAVNSPQLGYLTDMDQALLAERYDEALKQGKGLEGIERVDKLALSLAIQRWQQQMLLNFNNSLNKDKENPAVPDRKSLSSANPV